MTRFYFFFSVVLVLPCFLAGVHVIVGKPKATVISNINQMEHLEGEKYSQERNPRAYMSMRDYRSLPRQNQQPLGRNPNLDRSMRDYRDQWMSTLIYSVPSTYAPPASPHFTSTPQPQQQPTSPPVEQAILNLSKLVDNFIEEQRTVDVQANKEIDIVESSLNKELDEFQREIYEKFDILRQVQEELMQEPVEAPEEVPVEEAGGGRGKEAGKEPQKLIPQPIPIDLDPNVTVPPKSNPLLEYILPTAQPTPEAPTIKATPSLPMLQNIRKLMANVRAFATTSKTMETAHISWHSGWFECWFRFGALEPRHF